MKQLLLGIGILILACSCSTAKHVSQDGTNPKPSSAIPAKREFPVNPAISPCQDFYQYACSKVISSFKLRDDRSWHDFAFSDSRERILDAKKKYLAELTGEKHLKPQGKMLKTVYQACMNVDASKKEEIALVKQTLDQMKDIKTHEDFENWVASRIISKDHGLFSFGIDANLKNPDIYDAFLIPSVKSLPERSYYSQNDVMKDYQGVVADFFKTIGLDNPDIRAQQVLKFEKDFAQTFPLPAEFRVIWNTENAISKKELISDFPNLRLTSFLSRIPNKTIIRNMTPASFKFLNDKFASTDLDVLKDVYLYHQLSPVMDDAYPEFFNRLFAFQHKHLGGPEVRPVRAERCTDMVMDDFGKELDFELVPKLFPNFPAAKFKKLAHRIRASIIAGLKKNTWLSPKAKKEAIHKMVKVHLQMVEPQTRAEWDFNPPATYSPLAPYANLRTLHLNLIKRDLRRLKHVRNKNIWDMGPLTVNAYYSSSDNKFVIPVGILQYPFYDPTLPDVINLGAVGAVMGHELGHGIDDQGAKYDAEGRLRQWMSDQDIATFKARGAKLVAQFNAIGHNGQLTLGENTADLVGLTFAYRAAFPNGKGDQQLKREFFLQFARLWCSVERPKYRELMLKINPHSDGVARTNEQIKQQPGFAEAYQCHQGDPMVLPPDKRVQIW